MSSDLLVRTSERTAFNRCRWAWDREFNDRLKPTTAKPALRFGSLVHAALAAFYKPGVRRGPPPAQTFEQLYNEELETQTRIGFRDDDGEWHEAGHMGVVLLEEYVKEYGKDERYKVIVTEHPFKVAVRERANGRLTDRVLFHYTGVLDGVWLDREHDRLLIPDHKTATTIRTGYLSLDNQAGAYWTYGVAYLHREGLLARDAKLGGMLYNFVRKGKPDDRPRNDEGLYLNKPKKDPLVAEYRRKFKKPPAGLKLDELIEAIGPDAMLLGEVSEKQPPPLFRREVIFRDETDRARLHERVLQEVEEMQAVRDGTLAARKSPDQMICPQCSYSDICELHETGSDWEEMAAATMTTWDPYAEHEVYAGR